MSGTILVTGATGTVGSAVVRELAAAGVPVTAAVRNLAAALPAGVAAAEWDYERPETFGPTLAGVETLFLLTPPLHPREAEFGKQAIAAAKEAGVQRIVRLSALGVEPGQPSGHGQIEQAVIDSGLTFTTLRPTFFMQNLSEGNANSIKAGVLALAAGDGKVAWIDARDIGAVAAKILADGTGHAGQFYTLTGDEALNYDEVVALISAEVGHEVRYIAITDEEQRAGMQAAGLPETAVEGYSFLMGVVRNGWAAAALPTVREIIGRDAIRVAQFVHDYADSFR
jgi:uncharacterized protein YbjT (DUF2867 family)